MLDGDIQIGQHLLLCGNGVDQLVGKLVRIQIVQPDPAEVQLTQLPQQRRQLLFAVQVDAVAGDILSDDDALLHPGVSQMLRLGQHILHAAAAVFPAQRRYHAIGAAVVAALGNTQIGIVPRRRQHPVEFVDHPVDIGKAPGRAAGHHFRERRDDLTVAAGAHDAVHLRQLVQYLLLVALGQAPRHQYLAHLSLGLQRRHGQYGVDRLLLGAVDKPAGVDDHRVRTGGCLQQRMPRIAAQGHHLLCVHQILGTAKGNKCNLHVVYLTSRLFPAPTH